MTCIYKRQQINTSVNHVIVIYAILCFFICYFSYKIILYFYHILPATNIVVFRKSVTYDEKLRNFLFLAIWDTL